MLVFRSLCTGYHMSMALKIATRRASDLLASAAVFAAMLAPGCGEFVVYENVGVTWDARRTRIDDLASVGLGEAELGETEHIDAELGDATTGGAGTSGSATGSAGTGGVAPRGAAFGRAALFVEEGLGAGVWLEVAAAPGDEADGENQPVGGYFQPSHDNIQRGNRIDQLGAVQHGDATVQQGDHHGGTLLVILPGASTFYPRGMVEKARDYHLNYLKPYHDAGYATWTLALPECGSPYATADLAATRTALAWLLLSGGREALGIDRVHLIGASAGGVVALRAALEYDVNSVVDVSGLTQPDQLIERRILYRVIASLFPNNTGLCQFADTLREYGPPDGPGWGNLDVVGRVADLRCPLLAIHSMDDIIYEFSNLEALQTAIEALPPDGRPRAEFYARRGGHVDAFFDEDVTQRILQFLESIERETLTR